MNIILVHNHYDKEHLEAVKAEMINLGAPVIRAVYQECYNAYVAMEGCHRIRAAKFLGLVPEIEEMDYDAIKDTDLTDPVLGLDLDNPGCTVEWLVDGATGRKMIEFEE